MADSTNEYGCIDSVRHYVVVKPGYSVFIPNTFTPNRDGNNETFRVYGTGIVEVEMLIFYRWGQKLVFLGGEAPMTEGWDGTYEDEPVKQDVYPYRIRVKSIAGVWEEFLRTCEHDTVKNVRRLLFICHVARSFMH